MPKFGWIELFLLEFILFAGLWLWDDYIGTMFSLAISGMAFFILIISLMAEWIEPSKVPRWYFVFMIVTVVTPLLVGGLMVYIFEGQLDWFER